jgi:hypothetical protein
VQYPPSPPLIPQTDRPLLSLSQQEYQSYTDRQIIRRGNIGGVDNRKIHEIIVRNGGYLQRVGCEEGMGSGREKEKERVTERVSTQGGSKPSEVMTNRPSQVFSIPTQVSKPSPTIISSIKPNTIPPPTTTKTTITTTSKPLPQQTPPPQPPPLSIQKPAPKPQPPSPAIPRLNLSSIHSNHINRNNILRSSNQQPGTPTIPQIVDKIIANFNLQMHAIQSRSASNSNRKEYDSAQNYSGRSTSLNPPPSHNPNQSADLNPFRVSSQYKYTPLHPSIPTQPSIDLSSNSDRILPSSAQDRYYQPSSVESLQRSTAEGCLERLSISQSCCLSYRTEPPCVGNSCDGSAKREAESATSVRLDGSDNRTFTIKELAENTESKKPISNITFADLKTLHTNRVHFDFKKPTVELQDKYTSRKSVYKPMLSRSNSRNHSKDSKKSEIIQHSPQSSNAELRSIDIALPLTESQPFDTAKKSQRSEISLRDTIKLNLSEVQGKHYISYEASEKSIHSSGLNPESPFEPLHSDRSHYKEQTDSLSPDKEYNFTKPVQPPTTITLEVPNISFSLPPPLDPSPQPPTNPHRPMHTLADSVILEEAEADESSRGDNSCYVLRGEDEVNKEVSEEQVKVLVDALKPCVGGIDGINVDNDSQNTHALPQPIEIGMNKKNKLECLKKNLTVETPWDKEYPNGFKGDKKDVEPILLTALDKEDRSPFNTSSSLERNIEIDHSSLDIESSPQFDNVNPYFVKDLSIVAEGESREEDGYDSINNVCSQEYKSNSLNQVQPSEQEFVVDHKNNKDIVIIPPLKPESTIPRKTNNISDSSKQIPVPSIPSASTPVLSLDPLGSNKVLSMSDTIRSNLSGTPIRQIPVVLLMDNPSLPSSNQGSRGKITDIDIHAMKEYGRVERRPPRSNKDRFTRIEGSGEIEFIQHLYFRYGEDEEKK